MGETERVEACRKLKKKDPGHAKMRDRGLCLLSVDVDSNNVEVIVGIRINECSCFGNVTDGLGNFVTFGVDVDSENFGRVERLNGHEGSP